MPAVTPRRVILKRRPVGAPKPDDFEIVDARLPVPNDGEMLCRTTSTSRTSAAPSRTPWSSSSTPSRGSRSAG